MPPYGHIWSSNSNPASVLTSRFDELPYPYRSFSTPDKDPSAISPDLCAGQIQSGDRRGPEPDASPTSPPRSWRHSSAYLTSPRSASLAMDELEAISPMPTNLLTPRERFSVPTAISKEHPPPMSLAQRVRSIIASTSTTTGRPVAFGLPVTPNNRGILLQSPAHDPHNPPSPISDSPILSLHYSPRRMSPSEPAQPSLFSTPKRLQLPVTRNHESPQDGRGMENAEV